MFVYIKRVFLFRICYCLISIIILKNITVSENSRNIIHSEKICNIADRIIGFEPGTTKAIGSIMLFPILRFESHPMNKTRVLHEYIHHMQIAESFGLWQIVSQIEHIYQRFFLGTSVMESYLLKATEQEAYLNHHNLNYLNERKLRATWSYIWNKKEFRLENFQVILD